MENHTHNTFEEEPIPAEVVQAVKNVLSSFLLTAKNFTIYPEEHASTQRLVTSCKSSLDAFFKIEPNLKLDIEQGTILYKGEVVHTDPKGTEGLAFLFFRDGIRWIELKRGIENHELLMFFRLTNQYKKLQDESDSDLVTAFYGANFTNIAYEATEVFWEAETLLDFSQLEATEKGTGGGGYRDEEENIFEDSDSDLPLSIADASVDRNLWKLSNKESAILSTLVKKENDEKIADNIYEILLVILESQTQKEDFQTTLHFIMEEVIDSFRQLRFTDIQILLKALTGLYKKKQDVEWIASLIMSFFQNLGVPPVINALLHALAQLENEDPKLLKEARSVCLFLPALAIGPLSESLTDMKTLTQQRILMEIIGMLAQRNFEIFEAQVEKADNDVLAKLLIILGHLKEKKAEEILLQKIEHPADNVRKAAVTTLLKRDAKMITKLFHLIEDPDESIQQSILYGLGQQKSTLTESLLINYMEQKAFTKKTKKHISACFMALGGCASTQALPFLRKILLEKGWNSSFGMGKSVFRVGAALALLSINSVEAKDVLNDAAQSSHSAVSGALQKAIEEKQHATQ
jgi:HEAT repeat protein